MTTGTAKPPVVVGIDGSETALGAALWAAGFASAQGLPLTLLHVLSRWHMGGEDPSAESGSDSADAVLAAARTAVRDANPDLEVRTAAVKGSVAAVLADASENAAYLVVGTGTDEDRALGGHVVRIMHRAHCPVVVWRSPVARRTGKPLPVIVGVDESEASAQAAAAAFGIASAWHAPLTVVHMWEIGAAVGMGDLGGTGNMDWQLLDVLQNQQRQQVEKVVEPLARQYPNAHANTIFQDISPAKGLAELSETAQLVVVGSHGHGRLAEALMGSVSQNLIHHAECPVLVVR